MIPPMREAPSVAEPRERKAAATMIPARPADPPEPGGGWVATGLFVLVVLTGLALAVYTLTGPFLVKGPIP